MGEIIQNQRVKINFNTFDCSEVELNCRVESFDKDRITITSSKLLDEYFDYLQEGEELAVKIFTPDGIIVFNAIVLNSLFDNEFVIEYVEDSIKIQRRKYYRIPITTKVLIAKADEKGIIGYTINMSGGGIKFYCDETFMPEEILDVIIYFQDERAVPAKGIILPNQKLPENQYVLSFTEIEDHERERIIKKCFEAQFKQY